MKLESQFARYRVRLFPIYGARQFGVFVQYTDGSVSQYPVAWRGTIADAFNYALMQVRRRHHHERKAQELMARHRAAL